MTVSSKIVRFGMVLAACVTIGDATVGADELAGARSRAKSSTWTRTQSPTCEYEYGWWQTLRYGRVFPRWGEACRKRTRSTDLR